MSSLVSPRSAARVDRLGLQVLLQHHCPLEHREGCGGWGFVAATQQFDWLLSRELGLREQ